MEGGLSKVVRGAAVSDRQPMVVERDRSWKHIKRCLVVASKLVFVLVPHLGAAFSPFNSRSVWSSANRFVSALAARAGPVIRAIQKGTRVLISLWDSLMFGRVPGTDLAMGFANVRVGTRYPPEH